MLPYAQRVELLNITSLDLRLCISYCKIVHSLVGLTDHRTRLLYTMHFISTRSRAYKLYKPRATTSSRSCFLHVINVWSSLPESINFSSVIAVQQSIYIIIFSEFLRFSRPCLVRLRCWYSVASVVCRRLWRYILWLNAAS